MRKSCLVLFVLLLAMLVPVMPSSAGLDLFAALGWPLYSERELETHAGLQQSMSLSDSATGPDYATPVNSVPVVLVDRRYGLFNDIRYLRVNLMTNGITQEQLKAVRMALCQSGGGTTAVNGCRLVLDSYSACIGENVVTAEVDQNATRREGKWNLIIFKIKTVDHVMLTDRIAVRFIVSDVSGNIERYVREQIHRRNEKGDLIGPKELTEDEKQLVRAYIIRLKARDTLQFNGDDSLGYETEADTQTRKILGLPAPFDPDQRSAANDAANAYQAAIEKLQAEQKAERDKAAAREAAWQAEKQRMLDEAAAAKAKADAISCWPNEVRNRYTGKNGFVFVLVGMDRLPIKREFQLYLWQVEKGRRDWQPNLASPLDIDHDGEGDWCWDGPFPYEWTALKVSATNDSSRAQCLAPHSVGLRIIAVREDGVCYEVN